MKHFELLKLVAVFAILILLFQLAEFANLRKSLRSDEVSGQIITLRNRGSEVKVNLEKITNELLQAKKVLPVRWQGIPHKLVAGNIIDIEKLKNYSRRYGQTLTAEDLKIFEKDYQGNIEITPNNSVLIYNILWAAGFYNKSPILDYELEKYGWETVKNLAGYYFSFANLGNGSTLPQAGYNYFDLIQLSKDQKDLTMKIAGKSAVPSCGNALHLPDCSCSFAIDALIVMMASQGFSEQQIYQAMKDIYPYRFPGIYVQHALLYKLDKNQNWPEVNPEELVGINMSSAQGVAYMRKTLANILANTTQ